MTAEVSSEIHPLNKILSRLEKPAPKLNEIDHAYIAGLKEVYGEATNLVLALAIARGEKQDHFTDINTLVLAEAGRLSGSTITLSRQELSHSLMYNTEELYQLYKQVMSYKQRRPTTNYKAVIELK